MIWTLSLRISGFDSPTEVVPLFVRLTVIIPTSYGKKTSGSMLTDDTTTSEDASVELDVLVELVELLSVAACTRGTMSNNRIKLIITVFFFIFLPFFLLFGI
jgi:hypothetical protein